jgi:tetratricopeptide (TPR) repeat protein/transcriptional regulator with XRE-family HTH domain
MPRPTPHPPSALRRARQARGLSQRQVAEAIGTNRFTVTRWELGLAFPSPHFRQQLATLFAQSPEALGLVPPAATPVASPDLPSQPDPSISIRPRDVVCDPLLPPPLAPAAGLIGRAELLAQLKVRLLSGDTLVLSALQGLPGVGKTALALMLAHDPEMQAHFADGVLWAGLGQTPQVQETLARWGALLGLAAIDAARLTSQAWAQALRTAIGTRRFLFVLDDAWHLEAILACQVGGAGCAYLVTTRRPDLALQIAGAEMAVVPELEPEDGLALLARLAPQMVETEPEAARRLVQVVGGLPLGLLLLGKHLHGQSYSGQPRRIRVALERLQQSRERLHLSQPQAPLEAHPSLPAGTPLSLRASIGVSVAALSQEAQAMLAALALFPPKPNSFAEEAALAVSAGTPETLDALVDAGLVESLGDGRYTLHQTIVDFAREMGGSKKSAQRLATFFASYAHTHQRDYSALEREHTNALAALQCAADEQMPTVLIQTASALAPFWQIRGLYETAELYLLRAQEAARSLHDQAALANILLHYGNVLEQRGDYARAEEVLQEGLALARQIGQLEPLSAMLSALGRVVENRRDHAQAEGYYQEALALARQIGQVEQISQVLTNLAGVAAKMGNQDQAEAYYQQGLRLAREHGDRENISKVLQGLGTLAVRRGQRQQAEACWREGLALAYELGHHQRICILLSNLGALAHERGENEQAEAELQAALDLARKLGLRAQICALLSTLGGLEIGRKRYVPAEGYLREGLALAREMGHRERTCGQLMRLCELLLAQGEYARAEAYLTEGLALAREMNYPLYIAALLAQQGEFHRKQEQWEAAKSAFYEAMATASKINVPELQGNCLFCLAQIAVAQGDQDEARRLGQESLERFEPIGHYMIAQVREWLAALPPVRVS